MGTLPARGEVWLVDLGMVAKVRPCLVLSIPPSDNNDRALTTIVPHTTSTRGSRFEVNSEVRFLKVGAFDAQNLVTIPIVKLVRRLGTLPVEQMSQVEEVVKTWLGMKSTSAEYFSSAGRDVQPHDV